MTLIRGNLDRRNSAGGYLSEPWILMRVTVLVALFFAYTGSDILTSASSGQSGASRLAVHATLLCMSAIMLVSTFWLVLRKPLGINPRIAPLAFLLIPIWIIVADMIAYSPSGTLTRVGLVLWWFAAFSFARVMALHFQPLRWLAWPVFLLLLLYIGGMLWGRTQIQASFTVDFVVSGFAYFIVALFPVVRLLPQPFIRNFSVALIILGTLSSLKRGAIAILVLFFVIELLFSSKAKSQKVLGLFLGTGLIGIIYSQTNVLSIIEQRFALEELEDGSGRSNIYNALITQFTERDLWEKVLGTGSGSVGDVVGIGAAHNDILEMLISYGIIGLGLYLFWVFSGISVLVRGLNTASIPRELLISSLMAIIYLVVVGLFSQGIFGHASIYSILLLGWTAGLIDKERKNE